MFRKGEICQKVNRYLAKYLLEETYSLNLAVAVVKRKQIRMRTIIMQFRKKCADQSGNADDRTDGSNAVHGSRFYYGLSADQQSER